MFDSDNVIFAWAMGKAMLIVSVSIGALVCLAWAVTRKKEIAAQVGIPEDCALRSEGAVKTSNALVAPETNGESEGTGQILLSAWAERNNTGESKQSATAA